MYSDLAKPLIVKILKKIVEHILRPILCSIYKNPTHLFATRPATYADFHIPWFNILLSEELLHWKNDGS